MFILKDENLVFKIYITWLKIKINNFIVLNFLFKFGMYFLKLL